MDACDIFLTCLPRDVNETVIRNLLKSVGNVTKVKILDDKKNESYKLAFVGFGSLDEANQAVKIADRSTVFGNQIKASIARKSYDSNDSFKPNNDANKSFNNIAALASPKSYNNVGRGRGILIKKDISSPHFTTNPIILTDVTIKSKELINVEIVDLSNLECICARLLKNTENSKVEIADMLLKINSSSNNLRLVDCPTKGNSYLGKWDDDSYYRAELIDILSDGKFKVTFVDEGTSGDIITDLRIIPEGPLQRYPKQFTKICLGCKDNEDLRNFIINESEGKQVSVFWLGESSNGIPLVNLFLGEDEVVEKFIQVNKIQIRESFTIKFRDLPNHKSDVDCSNVTFIQSLSKSQSDFSVQLKEPMTIQCQKRTPVILPTPGDVCIYEKRNGVSNVTYLRCIVKRRQLFSFDILLFDSGEHLNNVSIDCLYAIEESHKISPPFTITCELDKSLGYNEDTFHKIICDENLKFSILNYKGNNRYLVTATVLKKEISRYPEILLKKFTGQSHKVLVTHLVSPLNFFVQIDKTEFVQTLNDIHEKLNISYNAPRFTSADNVRVGQAIVAPFSVDGGVGENFRATVLEKRPQSSEVHVYYIDYGNDGWVDYKQMFDVDEDIVSQPPLALKCTLNVDIRKEAWNHAIELFSRLVGFTDDDSSELVMQVMGDSGDKLLVDLTSLIKGSISMALDKSGTCFMKDDYDSICKPMCNGDAKRADKVESPARPQHIIEVSQNTVTKLSAPSSNQNFLAKSSCGILSAQTEDYGSLLKKVHDLEQRLAYLEKVVYK